MDQETERDYNKCASDSFKGGFREGAIDGKDSVFQNGFDQGYSEGFKSGFSLGIYKGSIKGTTGELDPKLSKTKFGACQICLKQAANSTPIIADCIEEQKNHTECVLRELHSKYQDVCNVILPVELV